MEILIVWLGSSLGAGKICWKTQYLIPVCRQSLRSWHGLRGVEVCWDYLLLAFFLGGSVLYDVGYPKHHWLSVLCGLKFTVNREVPPDAV